MINTDALTARAVNIDSRLRVRGEASDCVVQFEEPVHLPRDSVCWLTNASIPYVWPNVSQNVNNMLYMHTILNNLGVSIARQNAMTEDLIFDRKLRQITL